MAPIELRTYLVGIEVRKTKVDRPKTFTGPVEYKDEADSTYGILRRQRTKTRVDVSSDQIETAYEREFWVSGGSHTHVTPWVVSIATEVPLSSWIPGLKRKLVKVAH